MIRSARRATMPCHGATRRGGGRPARAGPRSSSPGVRPGEADLDRGAPRRTGMARAACRGGGRGRSGDPLVGRRALRRTAGSELGTRSGHRSVGPRGRHLRGLPHEATRPGRRGHRHRRVDGDPDERDHEDVHRGTPRPRGRIRGTARRRTRGADVRTGRRRQRRPRRPACGSMASGCSTFRCSSGSASSNRSCRPSSSSGPARSSANRSVRGSAPGAPRVFARCRSRRRTRAIDPARPPTIGRSPTCHTADAGPAPGKFRAVVRSRRCPLPC